VFLLVEVNPIENSGCEKLKSGVFEHLPRKFEIPALGRRHIDRGLFIG